MNTSQENNEPVFEDEVDLRELISVVWKEKIAIIVATGVVALSSIFISLSLTNYYTSEAVVIARDQQDTPLSEFSGLASLAGVNLDNAGSSLFKMMAIIESREFVKHLITFDDVLPSIMAAKSYDASSQELYFDPEVYDSETKTWTREVPVNRALEPSYLEAHKEYLEMISMVKDKITGHISIGVEHVSPVFAKEFLTLIIQEANNLNRDIDIESSSKALTYLTAELSQTPQLEVKKSISKLIEHQFETRMMASIHDDYVLIPLEPPFIPERKSGPIRSLIVILSTLVAGLVSVMTVLIRHYF
jgi:hypothetical protein|tara:strand:+ start:1200 stop:2108 length:909 start_codon:yes stop_codon:yes gene_type:complete